MEGVRWYDCDHLPGQRLFVFETDGGSLKSTCSPLIYLGAHKHRRQINWTNVIYRKLFCLQFDVTPICIYLISVLIQYYFLRDFDIHKRISTKKLVSVLLLSVHFVSLWTANFVYMFSPLIPISGPLSWA